MVDVTAADDDLPAAESKKDEIPQGNDTKAAEEEHGSVIHCLSHGLQHTD